VGPKLKDEGLIALNEEWDAVARLDLTSEQFAVIGYLVNGISISKIADLTGIPRKTIKRWVDKDALFNHALAIIKERRDALVRSEAIALRLKSFDVLGWFLLVDPFEMDRDQDAPKYTNSERVALLNAKLKVAQMMVGDMLDRTKVQRHEVTHVVDNNMTPATVHVIDDRLKALAGEAERDVPHISEVVDAEYVE